MEAQLEEKNQELQRVRVRAGGRRAGRCWGMGLRQAEAVPHSPLLPAQMPVHFSIPSGIELVAPSASSLLVGAPTTQTVSGQHWW